MKQVNAVIVGGRVELPPSVHIPDGTTVQVQWSEQGADQRPPIDRDELQAEDVAADLAWATGDHFQS